MSTITRTLRTALASNSTSVSRQLAARRYSGYGFDNSSPSSSSSAGPSGWRDEASNPVIRDQLVPIVVEQTVCRLITLQILKLTLRQEEREVMISTLDSFGNE